MFSSCQPRTVGVAAEVGLVAVFVAVEVAVDVAVLVATVQVA